MLRGRCQTLKLANAQTSQVAFMPVALTYMPDPMSAFKYSTFRGRAIQIDGELQTTRHKAQAAEQLDFSGVMEP